MQGIECMEKFLLRRFLPGNKLDIIHQQHVCRAIFFPESLGGMRPDRADHIISKFF